MASADAGTTLVNPRILERAQAVRQTLRRPRFLLPHACRFSQLAAEVLLNRFKQRNAGDPHAAGKTWPEWLPRNPLPALVDGPLQFPRFPVLSDSGDRVPSGSFAEEDADPEAYLARHRWSACQSAMLQSDAAAIAAAETCRQWIENPPPKSDAAWETYSAAERVANLLILLAARPAARAVDSAALSRFVDDSIRWILAHLEHYHPGRTNNHLLNDARALVVGGCVVRSPAAVETGLAIFARMSDVLFQRGGFLRERSSHYQVIVTNWLLDTIHFAGEARPEGAPASDLAALESLAERVTAATSAMLAHGGADDVHIGDLSPDSPPLLSTMRLRALYGVGPDAAREYPGGVIDDWLLDHAGDHQWIACVTGQFPPRAPLHGHTDAGHFAWRWRGRAILADAGRTRYGKDERSLAQADARGHNVLRVNGFGPVAESLATGGVWHLRPYSDARNTVLRESPGHFSLLHDGLRRLPGVGEHVRRVTIDGDTLHVEDRVDGRGEVDLELLWHFAPGWSPEAPRPEASLGERRVVVTCSSSQGALAHEWLSYDYSPAYGSADPAALLRWTGRVSLPATVHTSLSIR